MVMAQNRNTQYVAHEFVRQYYTMLHKDPAQLHRFYTKDSHLTHGGSPNAKSEEPVCGQEAIYEKIAQLNFRNCYAKIRSVDSHPTIGGGVVIQVNGELSNSGMAMRKFMQTFVLAQQEPKKYHVFNDIFRYQDETFEDTENEETVDGTVESENGYQAYESHTVEQLESVLEDQKTPNVIYRLLDKQQQNAVIENATNEESTINGHGIIEEPNDFSKPELTDEELTEQEVPEEKFQTQQDVVEDEEPVDDGTEFKEYESTGGNNIDDGVTEESAEASADDGDPPKPVSWAALTKKNTSVPTSGTPANQTKPVAKKVSPAPQKVQKKREEPPVVSQKKETADETRRRSAAPDNHQIFIGNLPNNISENDVHEAFKEFGNIVEIRLNPKNFGFIAFDGPDAPTKILNKTKTILIHNNTINTEVKRSVSGAGRGGGGSGGGGSGFRRGGSDKDRRAESKNRNSSGSSRSGKNNSFGQKRNDEVKTDSRNKDSKFSRDQKQDSNKRR